jgi:hypothetical protein|tara:strand:+ start:162 stop:392 length:231 start_codon:yes stop_codon:yes gene_type:complete
MHERARPFVFFVIVTTAVPLPHFFKGRYNIVDTIVEQTGETQITKSFHKGFLLRREFYFFHITSPVVTVAVAIDID